MNYYDAEGEYNPAADVMPADYGNSLPGSIKEGWSGLIWEAHAAVRVTLDEIALLASIVTAETMSHAVSRMPGSPGLSAYSLLLEPSLFKPQS